jgi:hypothetical protein
VRRRARRELVEPPGRLVAYDEADWLPLVDRSEYDPADWLQVRNGQPYGEPRCKFEDWLRGQAWGLWTRARHDWCQQHGWPGGLDVIELMQHEVALIRARGRRG